MEKKISLEDLSRRIKLGDPEAFALLYKKMSRKIYSYVYSFVLSKEDAEEIMHDVFLKVWDKRASIKEERSFQAFIYTIAKNTTLDKIRKYSVDNINLQKYFTEQDAGVDTSEDEEEVNQLLNQVHLLVEEMPFQRRKVFKLNRFEGMSQRSISEYLEISQGTVEKHISKAMQFLKEELRKRSIPTTLL